MFPRCLLPLLAALFALIPLRAAEVVEGPAATLLGPHGAVVRWRTDVPTGTRVTYGLTAGRLNRTAEGPLTDRHEVTLDGLEPGTRYFFAVGTARRQLATGQFVTASSPAAANSPASTSPASSGARPPSLLAKIIGLVVPPRPAPAPEKGERAAESAPRAAPPTRETWGDPRSLQDHYDRHGADFGARSAEDYAAQAWQFRQRARAGELLVKIDETGVQRVFDPATGAFAAYNRDGTTKTFFKPGRRDYFTRQPGRVARTVTP